MSRELPTKAQWGFSEVSGGAFLLAEFHQRQALCQDWDKAQR